MKLSSVKYADGITKGKQTKFGGLNHNLGAGDGELWDMRNMTSDHYPLLASRAPRMLYKTLENPNGLFSWKELCWVDGTGFYYGGELKGAVTAGEKTFAALGVYIVILPDKAYYNTLDGKFGSLESVWEGTSLTFTNGLLFDEDAEANTLRAAGVKWEDYFQAGDAVTIAGAAQRPENNKTSVIREIDGDKLYFYEYVFRLNGASGTTPITETGSLSVSRTMPDLLYICENENRLWGCAGSTIYSSKLGDIFNWNVFDGLDTDSYAADVGSAGIFTACVSFLGHPVFFKEENIYKVYGSFPSNFEVMGSASLGVAEGSSRSLAISSEMLFYLSRAGVMVYSGGIPQPVGGALGLERFSGAVGGSDGLKYYISMAVVGDAVLSVPQTTGDGETRADNDRPYKLYVYDPQKRTWHTEDETNVKYFARSGGNLYFLNDEGEIWATKHPPSVDGTLFTKEGTAPLNGDGVTRDAEDSVPYKDEGAVNWWAEFADFTDNDSNKKGISKIQIRMELDAGAKAEIFMKFDSRGRWESVAKISNRKGKKSYYLPIVPRRADHYRLKIQGVGGCRVYSLVREYYSGSELKS
ncbi:MAG: hypothetical protein FWG36_02065 [Oscillospiraceae bacterium]|nr:hypothetical protein [Oscillospiraceae bacterium]